MAGILQKSQFKQFGFPDGGTHCGNKDRARHLDGIRRIREGVDPKPKTLGSKGGFAGMELSIPELDYYVIVQRFPDLRSKDPQIKRNAWLKFMGDPASEPYRIHRRKRRPCRSITAR